VRLVLFGTSSWPDEKEKKEMSKKFLSKGSGAFSEIEGVAEAIAGR